MARPDEVECVCDDCVEGGLGWRMELEEDDCLWKALTNALTAGYRTSLADAASHTTETKRGLDLELHT